ncbi:hypothetical protein [Brachybacterium subflavum]|uniref:hypothetical protein n=1 Tax=Brachybacterium subflavum TaxID=2585206 RepID=UPI0012664107|nr:hypothetical protein [Brachybacterium subflavum]
MNITDRARAEAERRHFPIDRPPMTTERCAVQGFIDGAEWQASLPPTDEEVLAALNAYTGEDDLGIESWGSYADDMRAALVAAREVQR